MAGGTQIRFEGRAQEVRSAVRRGARRNLTEAISIWHRSLVHLWSGQRSGRRYRIPDSNVFYSASRPGEPPANPTGTTRSSYHTRVPNHFEALIGSRDLVALWLETGTSRMAPRPVIEPSMETSRAAIVAALARPING